MGQVFCPSRVMVLTGKRNMKQMILQVIVFMVYTKKEMEKSVRKDYKGNLPWVGWSRRASWRRCLLS